MRIFYDFEMTGLHQKTTPISLGMVTEEGQQFYAEFIDYDKEQITPWVKENVINQLVLVPNPPGMSTAWGKFLGPSSKYTMVGYHQAIANMVAEWLKQFNFVEMWGDVQPHDWMLFCELFPIPNNDTAERLPRNVYYIPFDLATLMKIKGVDPDISREEFSGIKGKHNALRDAFMIMACYDKLRHL